jgi:hypothetical protein
MVLEILSYIGGGGAAIAMMAYLAKQLVLHRLQKDLADYRASLEAERDRQVQSLRHEFEKAALEHQVTFKQLFAQRHDSLRELHRSLRKCLDQCLAAARSDGDPDVPGALDSLKALHEQVWSCELYLPRDTCDRWHSLFSEMRLSVDALRDARAVRTQNWDADRKELVRAVDEHATAWRALNEGLVDDIREIIGTKKESNQPPQPTAASRRG